MKLEIATAKFRDAKNREVWIHAYTIEEFILKVSECEQE